MNDGRLRMDDLALSWPDGTPALEGIDLEVASGTCLVVLGGSGAGKTTLLRAIAGLERPTRGTITLGDRVLSSQRAPGHPGLFLAPEERGVGVVFQALELWPQMTVAEHIAFGLPGRTRGRAALANPQVEELAEQVGLPLSLLARRPGTLSGGEQQRVAIARTLAANPAVILYDEPLANLDPELRESLRSLIRRLAREHGTTLVYVTHDPQEALELGQSVAIFRAGTVVEVGIPQDVYAHPRTLLGARALGPVSVVAGHVQADHVETPLGTYPTSTGAGPCSVLWRPESIRIVTAGGVAAEVIDVTPQGCRWRFSARVGGATVQGESDAPLAIGSSVSLAAATPAAVLALPPVPVAAGLSS